MKLLTSALALSASAAVAHASVLIDHFTTPAAGQQVQVSIPPGGLGSSASDTSAAAGALGGWRTVYVEVTGGDLTAGGSISAAANHTTAPDNYQYLSSVAIDGWSEVTWDANGAGLSADLSACPDGFLLEDVRTDLAATFTIFVTDGAAVTASSALATGLGFSGDLSFPWASFAGLGNLADIDKIVLRVNAPQGGDVVVHALTAVPEPGPTAAVFAGLLGLFGLGRKLVNRG